MNGKGDRNRSNSNAYREGWDRIFGEKQVRVPTDLLERVGRYFRDHPDEHPMPGPVSVEEMEPIVGVNKKTDTGFEIDWIPLGTIPPGE